MKNSKRPGRRKHPLILFAFLAILCIGTAELVACYFFAPVLYLRITAPVRWAAQEVYDTVSYGASVVSNAVTSTAAELSASWDAMWEELTKPKEASLETPDSQLAGEPTLISDGPISDPSITELQLVKGQEILTGGSIPVDYYNQGDSAWSSEPYGSDNIGGYGCGPTAMTMAVTSMTDHESDPAQMAQWAAEQGYWAKGSGSYYAIVEGTAEAFGLTAEGLEEYTVDALQEALLSGKILVALMGPGHFTKGGHFILLRGITLSGSILVADPNSRERSLMEWDPQLILDELSGARANGAPLWALSVHQS